MSIAVDDSESEDGFVDNNDTHCKVCKGDTDAAKLLCCETCPAVYHLYCLNPPLARIPKGDWYCPECTKALQLDGVERILDVRTVPSVLTNMTASSNTITQPSKQEGAPSSSAAAANTRDAATAAAEVTAATTAAATATVAASKPIKEYYIKWKNQSYLHCSWVSQSELDKACKMFPHLKNKVRKFYQVHQAEVEQQAEATETGDLVHGVNPLWLQVRPAAAQGTTTQLPC